MPHKFFDVGKVGCYCVGVTHSTEKRKDGETKVMVLTLRVEPFDAKLASAVDPMVRATLFKLSTTEPQSHLRKVHFGLGLPRQRMQIFTTPDTPTGKILFDDVRIDGVYARTSSDNRAYSFVFKAVFGPCSATELEAAEAWRTTMAFVTFSEAEYNEALDLAPDSEDQDDEEDEEDQPRLPESEFDTEADGLPKGDDKGLVKLLAKAGANVSLDAAAAWSGWQFDEAAKWAREQIAANAEAEPGTSASVHWPDHVSAAHHNQEPARQKLHSHAGGKKRQAKASTDRGRAAKKGRK